MAVLLREHGAPEGLGPVHSIGIGPASVMSADLAERCNSFVTSLCLRSVAAATAELRRQASTPGRSLMK